MTKLLHCHRPLKKTHISKSAEFTLRGRNSLQKFLLLKLRKRFQTFSKSFCVSFKQVSAGLEILGFCWTVTWWSRYHSFNSSLFFCECVFVIFTLALNHQTQSWARTQLSSLKQAKKSPRYQLLWKKRAGRWCILWCHNSDIWNELHKVRNARELFLLKLVWKHEQKEQDGDTVVVHSCHVSVNKKFSLTQRVRKHFFCLWKH